MPAVPIKFGTAQLAARLKLPVSQVRTLLREVPPTKAKGLRDTRGFWDFKNKAGIDTFLPIVLSVQEKVAKEADKVAKQRAKDRAAAKAPIVPAKTAKAPVAKAAAPAAAKVAKAASKAPAKPAAASKTATAGKTTGLRKKVRSVEPDDAPVD